MKWNQCIYCGRFISYDDMENGEASAEFTPDSAYTTESVEWHHVLCLVRRMWGAYDRIHQSEKKIIEILGFIPKGAMFEHDEKQLYPPRHNPEPKGQ